MAASTERREYYREGNRLVLRRNTRTSIYAQWPTLGRRDDLVASFENVGHGDKVEVGHAGSPR
jgi:hypothetical protein